MKQEGRYEGYAIEQQLARTGNKDEKKGHPMPVSTGTDGKPVRPADKFAQVAEAGNE